MIKFVANTYPPQYPADEFFRLNLTNFVTHEKPWIFANKLMTFIANNAFLVKINIVKYSIKFILCAGEDCSVTVQFYTFEKTTIVELSRLSGCSVAFNSLFNYIDKNQAVLNTSVVPSLQRNKTPDHVSLDPIMEMSHEGIDCLDAFLETDWEISNIADVNMYLLQRLKSSRPSEVYKALGCIQKLQQRKTLSWDIIKELRALSCHPPIIAELACKIERIHRFGCWYGMWTLINSAFAWF